MSIVMLGFFRARLSLMLATFIFSNLDHIAGTGTEQRVVTEIQSLMGLEAGLVAADLVPDLGAWELLGGRAATTDLGAAPAWLSLGVAIAAVAALI